MKPAATLRAALLLLLASTMTLAARDRGPVTNLPMPRYVSLKAAEGNVRRGPSLSHRIDWVFKRRAMPLRVVAEYGHWRRVQDIDGATGWIHYTLLSGARTVLIQDELIKLYAQPDHHAKVRAFAETGVVARLGTCSPDWCRVTVDGTKGWALKAGLWGVTADEVRE